MKVDSYKDVDLSYVPYSAKDVSNIDALASKYGGRIACGNLKRNINEAECLLTIHNSERYRMAPLFYGVAECASQLGEAKTLKGIAIAIPNEEFRLNDLIDMQSRMAELFNYFRRKTIYALVSMLASAVAFVSMTVMFFVVVVSWGILDDRLSVALIVSKLAFLITFMATTGAWIVDSSLMNRLKGALDERWLQSFIAMNNRLQYADKKGDKYLYNVQKGDFDEVARAYLVTKAICKENGCEAIVDEESPKNVLFQPLPTE